MKIDALLPSKYLKQSDVDGEVLVTVKDLKKVNVARDDEEADYKYVIGFKEYEKPMVLNATNIKRLGKALGDDTDDWPGGQVVLYVDENIEFGGNVVGGLRIRAAQKKTVQPRRDDVDSVNRKLAAAADDDQPPF